jgi:peptide subunit release factor 1 (eRF1)
MTNTEIPHNQQQSDETSNTKKESTSTSNIENRTSPQTSLEELKRRLSAAQDVVVDSNGRLHDPNNPDIATKPPQEKTVIKPQRWFHTSL